MLLQNVCVPGSLGSTLKAAASLRNMAHKIRFGSTSDPSKIASVRLPEADEYGKHSVLYLKLPPAFCEGGKASKQEFGFLSSQIHEQTVTRTNSSSAPLTRTTGFVLAASHIILSSAKK